MAFNPPEHLPASCRRAPSAAANTEVLVSAGTGFEGTHHHFGRHAKGNVTTGTDVDLSDLELLDLSWVELLTGPETSSFSRDGARRLFAEAGLWVHGIGTSSLLLSTQ